MDDAISDGGHGVEFAWTSSTTEMMSDYAKRISSKNSRIISIESEALNLCKKKHILTRNILSRKKRKAKKITSNKKLIIS